MWLFGGRIRRGDNKLLCGTYPPVSGGRFIAYIHRKHQRISYLSARHMAQITVHWLAILEGRRRPSIVARDVRHLHWHAWSESRKNWWIRVGRRCDPTRCNSRRSDWGWICLDGNVPKCILRWNAKAGFGPRLRTGAGTLDRRFGLAEFLGIQNH
jgi:hypothetical protein